MDYLVITIKALKCGDSSIIRGVEKQLLIDCGSDNAGDRLTSSEFSYAAIKNEIKKKCITDLMITHFHKDHFNGILNVSDTYRFETIYLPYSIVDSKVVYTGALARLLAIASTRSWGFRLAKNVIKLFEKLEKVTNNIHFVQAGDMIPFDGNTIRVLWPQITYSYDMLPVKKVYHSGIKQNILSPFMEYEETESLLSVEKLLASTFVEIVGNDNKELLEAYELFKKTFDDYIIQLHNGKQESTKSDNTIFEVYKSYNNLIKAREKFRRTQDEATIEKIKLFSRQQYHSLVASMNAISIICDCDQKFAYLGDAPTDIIDYLSGSFNSYYQCVKIQHHGTETYYTRRTPKGKHWIISNGGYERRKVSNQFVSNTQEIIICTNAHEDPGRFCDYYLTTGQCSKNCHKVVIGYNITV